MNWRILIPAGFAAYFLFGMAQLAEAADEFSKTAANFKQHCSSCHGVDRLGGLGPALIPENLARLRKPEAEKVIREGRQATQMRKRWRAWVIWPAQAVCCPVRQRHASSATWLRRRTMRRRNTV